FDAGDYVCDSSFANLAEAVINNLQAVGIRAKLRPLERAAFYKGYSEKGFKNLTRDQAAALGMRPRVLRHSSRRAAPTSMVAIQIPTHSSSSKWPNSIPRSAKRCCTRSKSSPRSTNYAHLWQFVVIHGVGPRVGESGLGLIVGHPYSTPYEDVTLKG